MIFSQPSLGKDELKNPRFFEQRQMGAMNYLQPLQLQLSAVSMKVLLCFFLGFLLLPPKLTKAKHLTALKVWLSPSPY